MFCYCFATHFAIRQPNTGVVSILEEDWSSLRCKESGDDIFLRRLIQNCQENPYFEVVSSPSIVCKPSITAATSTCSCSSTSSSCCCAIYSVPTATLHHHLPMSGSTAIPGLHHIRHEMCSPHSRPGSVLSGLPPVLQLLSTSPTPHTSRHLFDSTECFRIRHFAGTVSFFSWS